MDNWIARADRVVMQTYGRQPLVLVRGEGCRVWDEAGREYLDFVAGLAVCNLGHAHPEVARAAAAQLTTLVHVSNLYYTTPMVELAEALVSHTFADRVFFCNSGAEALEGLIKLCRRYSREKYGPGRHKIICMLNSFHGRTFGALSATGQEKFQQGFEPLLPGFVFVPFNDLPALEAAVDGETCAVLLEPIQGEGGVNLPDPGYLPAVRRLCDARGLLLALDEVQTGMGRTGRLFAHEHFGITPDVLATAKGLANGLPMGALLATGEVAQAFVPGTHASTFGGGPVIARAALTVLQTLTAPGFLAAVREKGDYLVRRLTGLARGWPVITQVRGLGLMWGLELSREGAPLVAAARERGLLINCTQGNIIRLLPPLVITREELDRGLELLAQAMEAAYP
ncbi:MAG: acetylornithine transaminase [Actinomycetia bacterium]|nr:acetylornithine transaminase [Actinomycetes bacterium]